jgi:RNA polymerase sigma-70 factor (ECF subfamily)
VAEAATFHSYQSVKPYLFSVAYRMTGSASDAEDLVQDAWIRYLDAGEPAVGSLRAWLTTVISRLALDYLKSARVKREQYTGTWMPEPVLTSTLLDGPEETVEQREEVSIALLMLLERLSPEQRVVYVLREGFGLSYDEIAGHIDKSAANCRQIYRRAHMRLAGERRPSIAPSEEHRALTERVLAAIATGDASQVASLLSEDVVWEGDGGGQRLATIRAVVGADRVSRGWVGLTQKSAIYQSLTYEFIDVNGAPALAALHDGKLDRVTMLDIRDGRVSAIRSVLALDKLAPLARSLGVEVAEPVEWSLPGRTRPLVPRGAEVHAPARA